MFGISSLLAEAVRPASLDSRKVVTCMRGFRHLADLSLPIDVELDCETPGQVKLIVTAAEAGR